MSTLSIFLRIGRLALLLLCAIPLAALAHHPQTVIAAPIASPLSVASRLSGYLPDSRSENSFQLIPNRSNVRVSVTLDFDADPSLPGNVNFFVIGEEGIPQLQAGAPAYSVAIAAGNPLPNAGDYVRRADFNVVKQKNFMVIVYSDAARPVHYSLTVFNATLVDTWGQAAAGMQAQNNPAPVTVNLIPSSPSSTGFSITKATTRLTELVFAPGQQAVFTIQPSRADVGVAVTMQYEPRTVNDLRWLAQMYLFDEDRYHQYQAGERAEIVNIAAGNRVPNGEAGTLQLRVRAVDREVLTLLVVNRSDQVVVYSLQVSGGRFQPQ